MMNLFTLAIAGAASVLTFATNVFAGPQYHGHCSCGVAQNGKVAANPNLWRTVDDKLYLNTNDANGGWVSLKAKRAFDRATPFFTSAAHRG